MPSLAAELSRLYALPPRQFTTARNELAKELRRAGRGDDAATVTRLAKPTPSAWAVTRLFEVEGAAMRDLLAAGERARGGGGRKAKGAAAIGGALAEAQELLPRLARRAAELLVAAGEAASETTRERLAGNLLALAFRPDLDETRRRRWLDGDLEPPGFEVMAALQVAAGGGPLQPLASAPAPAAAPSAATGPDREALARAERELERAESQAQFLRRKAERAAAAVEEARRRLEAAEAERAAARDRVAAAERDLAAARAAAEEAAAAAELARAARAGLAARRR